MKSPEQLTRQIQPILFIVAAMMCSANAMGQGIRVEKLDFPAGDKPGISVRAVLTNEIADLALDLVAVMGPDRYTEPASTERDVVWLFVSGTGSLRTRDQDFRVSEETIARAPLGWSWELKAAQGERFLALRIRKSLNAADKLDLKNYPQNNAAPYVKKFSECTPYKEAIKSPKTTSRSLLPENYVPRMAVGTVETSGPDQVGSHKHPMLEQLFLGLKGNDITVTADDAKVSLSELSILHIPLGSYHGAQVAEGKKLYYVWMDFFMEKQGQEWLKMHKPVEKEEGPSR